MSALHRERWFPVWLVLPGSVSLMVLWLLPLAMLLQLLFSLSPETLQEVYQLGNLLWRDEIVQHQMGAQVARLGLAVMLEVVLGLMLARWLPVQGSMASIWCALLMLVLLTPLVVSIMSWQLMLNPDVGLAVLDAWFGSERIGRALAVTGLHDPDSLLLHLLRDLWQWVPLFALLAYARLRTIERIRYDAVRFDGGTAWHVFRLLEWPALRRMLLLGVLFRLLAGVIIDVDLFHLLAVVKDGAMASMMNGVEGLEALLMVVPGQAPLSWLLPSLLSSAEHIGPAAVPILGAYMAIWQVILVLPLMVALLFLVGRGTRYPLAQARPGAHERGGDVQFGNARRGLLSCFRLLALGIGFVFLALPLAWLAGVALLTDLPDGGHFLGLGHFMAVLDDPVWRMSLVRTALRAAATAVIAVLLALPMAYSWSRRMLAGDRLMATLMMIGLMMPAVVLALPMVQINELLGWQGLPAAVGVAHLVYAVPVAVWVLVSSLSRVPPSLDEMAMRDGFGFMHFLWRVLLPAIRGGVWVALLACFLMSWMEFLFARVLGSAVWPPAVVLLSESVAALSPGDPGGYSTEWHVLAAAAWMVLLPVVLVLLLLRRQLPALLSLLRVPGHARLVTEG
ncbi:MAG: ABC transporter permease subunit [Lautropia sp.]|nr:ABC transporter permease subunit [Lautropia sp.]